MKNLLKLITLGIFALFGLGLFINQTNSGLNKAVSAQTTAQPTPPDEVSNTDANTNANMASNADANTETTNANAEPQADTTPEEAGDSDKKIPKEFTLGTDSFSEYGEVYFNHDTHAFEKYSPDGKSIISCVFCHHTDQPKSAMKPPLVTSERDVVLTLAVWQKSDQAVTRCRACHFQDGEVPDDKEMPVLGDKELNNEIAYHINCNTCHDEAAKLRPELKKKKGFATTNDCFICHVEN